MFASKVPLFDDKAVEEQINHYLQEQKLERVYNSVEIMDAMKQHNVLDLCRTKIHLQLFCRSLFGLYRSTLSSLNKPALFLDYCMMQICVAYIHSAEPYFFQQPEHRHRKKPSSEDFYNHYIVREYCGLELEFLSCFAYCLVRNNLEDSSFSAVCDHFTLNNQAAAFSAVEAGVMKMNVLECDPATNKYYFKDTGFMQFMAARFIASMLVHHSIDKQDIGHSEPYFLTQMGKDNKILREKVYAFVMDIFTRPEYKLLIRLVVQLLKESHGIRNKDVLTELRHSPQIKTHGLFGRNNHTFAVGLKSLQASEAKLTLSKPDNLTLYLSASTQNNNCELIERGMQFLEGSIQNIAEYRGENVLATALEPCDGGFKLIMTGKYEYPVRKVEKALTLSLGALLVNSDICQSEMKSLTHK